MKFKLFIAALLLTPLFSISQDFAVDKKYGQESAALVEKQIGIYNHQSADLYVKAIGKRLVDQLGDVPLDFSFHLVDMTEPNAFALPGGYLYVSRGLLMLINDEDELAGIMGHEIIHVTKRHSVKQMKQGILPSLLKIPGAIVGATVNKNLGDLINTPINFGTSVFMANYSRKHEKESDQLGVKLSSAAGYNPQKLAVILERLSREVEYMSGEEEKKSYLSSHPYTPKRTENINKLSGEIAWTKKPAIASSRNELFKNIEGIYTDQNPKSGIFTDSLFLHPDLNLHMVFPEQWQTFNFPVALGAMNKTEDAMLFLTIETEAKTPGEAAHKFKTEVLDKNEIKANKSEALEINGLPAYSTKIVSPSQEYTAISQMTWIQIDSTILNIVTISLESYYTTLQTSINSIRKLNKQEKESIAADVLRIAHAQQGETIFSLCERTNCNAHPDFISLINAIDKDAPLKLGDPIKIIVKEPYFKKQKY
jgi:predicted Zn-dependent protease